MKSPRGAGSNGGVPRRKKWPGAEPCPPPAPTDPQRRLHLSGPLIRPACLPYRPLCTLLAALPVDPLGYPPRGPSGLGTPATRLPTSKNAAGGSGGFSPSSRQRIPLCLAFRSALGRQALSAGTGRTLPPARRTYRPRPLDRRSGGLGLGGPFRGFSAFFLPAPS